MIKRDQNVTKCVTQYDIIRKQKTLINCAILFMFIERRCEFTL